MSNPTALVTGGTSGIGKATTELLHQRGYQVLVDPDKRERYDRLGANWREGARRSCCQV